MTAQHIVNPEKWIGRYVLHTANWMTYQFPLTCADNSKDDYFVDPANGRLYRLCDQAYYGEIFSSLDDALLAGYDECYYYSREGLMTLIGH